MIFSGDLCDKVLDGAKTVTRRPVRAEEGCRYAVGKTYAIQRRRGAKGLGPRIRIVSVTRTNVQRIAEDDAIREGFASRNEFLNRWHNLYAGRLNQSEVWRIEFELCGSADIDGSFVDSASKACSGVSGGSQ